MTEPFEIADGAVYVWDSASIAPSIESAPSPTGPTPLLTINPNASNVYVYVKVDSKSSTSIGCPIDVWKPPSAMNGFLGSTTATGSGSSPNGEWTFTAAPSGDVLQNNVDTTVKKNFGFPLSGCRSWGWSLDGKFFAYAFGPTAGNTKAWRIVMVALDDARRFDGGRIVSASRYSVFATYSPPSTVTFANAFTINSFGWVGSSGFFAQSADTTGQIFRVVLCPRMPTMAAAVDSGAVGSGWLYAASPCGRQLACLPKVPSGATAIGVTWISTVEGKVVLAKILGTSQTVKADGMTPSVTTLAHTAKGVSFNPGAGAPILIDDPDGTAAAGGLTVQVDRIQASTWLVNQNIHAIGVAAGPEIKPGQSAWVQIPPPANWFNDSDQHWCVVAQAYDTPSGVPRLWPETGPVFPTGNDRCAQRNVTLKP